MKTLFTLLPCVALSASAQVVVRPVVGAPTLGSSAAAWNSGASASYSAASAQLLNAPLAAAPAFVAPTMPVSAAAPLPIDARAALVAATPVLTSLPASASGESQSAAGRIVFDAAATRAEKNAPVLASAAGEAPLPLKPAAPAKKLGALAPVAPLALAAASFAEFNWIVALVIGAAALGIFLLLRWSKKNLEAITREELAEFDAIVESRKAEWTSIPGVKSLEIVRLSRMDDTPPAYLKITVDHIGPDNKDLLPPHHQKWNPVIKSMFPQELREAARIASLDGKGWWPIAVVIAR